MSEPSGLTRKTIGLLAQVSLDFGLWLPSQVPMLSRHHAVSGGEPVENLFVLLPGIQDRHLDFEMSGFVRSVREQRVLADLLAVDAHVGYYARQTILHRLRNDILLPARQAGYKNIWLVGTSLGGLGSALYASQYENDVDGVLLLAPFLGESALIREIERAGGPGKWRASRTREEADARLYRAELWDWLDKYFQNPERRPYLYLGFGNRDRFAYAHGYLAAALSKDRVLLTSGAHDWPTWHRIWSEFLERFQVHHLSSEET
ncbi:MAG: hypothetical protein NDI61_10890 [Bdellovibrionaceae bacterium]|nr:hypothetical protein [Pseudobdellovibrionaceae bacterium]